MVVASPRRAALGAIAAACAALMAPVRAAARQLGAPRDPDEALAELIAQALDADPDLRAEIGAWLAEQYPDEVAA
jgi:hypothetical protein